MTKLNTSYMLFVFEFSDPSKIDHEKLTKDLTFPLAYLFKKQKHLSDARKVLGKEDYKRLFAVYFNQFKDISPQLAKDFHQEIEEHKQVFLRGIGKDRLETLTKLVSKMSQTSEKRKGLLFEEHA